MFHAIIKSLQKKEKSMRRKALWYDPDGSENFSGFLIGFINDHNSYPKALFEIAELGAIQIVDPGNIQLIDQETVGTSRYECHEKGKQK